MVANIFAFGFRAGRDGQKRRNRVFLNKFSEFFFNQLDKGMTSPFVFVATTGLIVAASWKLADRYFKPTRELVNNRVVGSRVPLSDTHNSFWGLRRSVPVAQHAETMGESLDSDLKRPSLVHSEHSETAQDSDWIVLELSEFDPQLKDDIYYRSLHALNMRKVDPATLKLTDAEQRELDHKIELSKASGRAPVTENDRFMNPHIHGMVKCKGVSSDNNCIPYAGSLTEEVSRKLMLALGPAHLLRDPVKTLLPRRFSLVKEAPVKTLICGLKSGDLARWLSAAFPNYEVDVVESDGAIVKLARRFLGFREHSTLNLYIADPVEYARKLASREINKLYDLVVIDCVDGSNQRQPPPTQSTFQDSADRGKLNFGTVTGVEEFRDIIHTQQSYYGNRRVAFDLAREINQQNFRVLEPNKEYSIEHYLPIAHPLVMERRAAAAGGGGKKKKDGDASWWPSWLGGSGGEADKKK
ncbi:Hypothetical protein, putative [Bodo saltans]|uniref:Uncharacterized protein n=1 Tax=Bodo saltans TaxID=75058 RepID=A0A0S4IJV1_BODSA|nr:Hypothetical protein, putative [Bodo saltans]|eukprot:CUE55578.1 Hypothetical protein, putative [Bodo saltans]